MSNALRLATKKEPAVPSNGKKHSRAKPVPSPLGELQTIPIDRVHVPDDYPSRATEEEIEAIAASIRTHGQVAPIIVDQAFTLIDGGCRYRAAKLAGMTEITCLVKRVTPEQARAMHLISLVLRVEPRALERAHALYVYYRDLVPKDAQGRARSAAIRWRRYATSDYDVASAMNLPPSLARDDLRILNALGPDVIERILKLPGRGRQALPDNREKLRQLGTLSLDQQRDIVAAFERGESPIIERKAPPRPATDEGEDVATTSDDEPGRLEALRAAIATDAEFAQSVLTLIDPAHASCVLPDAHPTASLGLLGTHPAVTPFATLGELRGALREIQKGAAKETQKRKRARKPKADSDTADASEYTTTFTVLRAGPLASLEAGPYAVFMTVVAITDETVTGSLSVKRTQ